MERWRAIPFSKVKRRELRWVFKPFIPDGMITTVAGPGGVGKSTMIIDIIARITTGKSMPQIGDDAQEQMSKGSAIILTKEDDAGLIIRPRLEAAGADLSRVHFIAEEPRSGESGDYEVIESLDTGTRQLERIVQQIGDLKLILIDPITAFFGKLNFNKDDQIRKLLQPLGRLAAKYNIAVINVIHLNKNAQMKGTSRILGGGGIVNIGRSTLFVAAEEGTSRRLLIGGSKGNLLPPGLTSVAFTMRNADGQAQIDWGAEYEDVDLNQVLAGKSNHVTKLEQASSILRGWLADGPLPTVEIKRRTQKLNFHFNTMRAAKKEIAAIARRRDDAWSWELPQDDKATRQQEQGKGLRRKRARIRIRSDGRR
jgi:putative DNA primase/helicase